MKLLAIDTATEACSVALLSGDEIISRYELAPRRHNQVVLKMAESVLAEAGIALPQLDGLAFGQGPGSFTGVRISAGIIQGLALGLELPVAPVSTLAAMAHRAFRENNASSVLVAIDARMQEVYWGAYKIPGLGIAAACCDERVCAPEAVIVPKQESGDMEERWSGVGTGWESYATRIDQAVQGRVSTILADFFPHAHDIVLLGKTLFERQQSVPAEQAMPVYLRDQVAVKSK